jgi:hypothetical protein
MLLAGAALHAPLLRGLAQTLIADDGPQAAEHMLVLNCERVFDRASQAYHLGRTSKLLYIDLPAKRLGSLEIVPSWGTQCSRELQRRGVPPTAIFPIGGTAGDPWQTAHRLHEWLEARPQARVLVLCSRFASGGVQFAFSSVLETTELNRIAFWSPADPRFDESNWWRSHAGRRELAVAIFTQAYFRLHGEDVEPPPPTFDPDAYERELRGLGTSFEKRSTEARRPLRTSRLHRFGASLSSVSQR